MPKSKLTPAQRRRDAIDRIISNDFDYFERFPHRSYRVRVLDPVEIEEAELDGVDMSLAPGRQHYIAILNLLPGTFITQPFHGPTDIGPDLTNEQRVRALFKESGARIDLPGRMTRAEILAIAETLK
jgi:hypothetical protein